MKINTKKRTTKPLEDALKTIEDRDCNYWNADSKKYFEAHMHRYGIPV